MAYRYSLGLNEKYQFGTEIEFKHVPLIELYEMYSQKHLPVDFIKAHKMITPSPTYDRWILDIDATVTDLIDSKHVGGELSSKIMQDYTRNWIELQKICQVLREADARINEYCSNHITVNLSAVGNINRFFEYLTRIIVVYETEIETFYQGEYPRVRETRWEYARDMASRLSKIVRSIDFSSPTFMGELIHDHNCFMFRDAISLYKFPGQHLMEFRYPNGTINEEVIQNNINFTMKLVDAIANGKFDLSTLDRQIDKFDVSSWMRVQANPYKWGELIEIISQSIGDKAAFDEQFQRVRKR